MYSAAPVLENKYHISEVLVMISSKEVGIFFLPDLEWYL